MSDIRIVWDDAVAHGDWLLRPLSSSTEHVVVSEPAVFGTGDGVRTQFQLSKPPVIDLAVKIFRNDWQGNQRLYPTPRTNSALYSFAKLPGWNGVNSYVLTPGHGTAPDGSNESGFLSTAGIGVTPGCYPGTATSVNYVAGTRYVGSIWFKSNASFPSKRVRLLLNSSGFGLNKAVYFDISTGAVSVIGGSSLPESYGSKSYPGGWTRVWLSQTATVTGAAHPPIPWFFDSISAGEGVEFWGEQIEVGTEPTSYIRTDGAAASVTDYAASPTGLITMGQVPAIDASLTWTGSYSKPISVGTGDLESGADLATAMLLSIFTDAMAASDDVIPDGTGDPRGWWGDQFDPDEPLGSKLWLLHREKQTRTTLNRAYDYLVEALKWLVDDGVVARFEITVEWVRESFLGAQIIAYSPDGTSLHTGKYLWAWNGIN